MITISLFDSTTCITTHLLTASVGWCLAVLGTYAVTTFLVRGWQFRKNCINRYNEGWNAHRNSQADR